MRNAIFHSTGPNDHVREADVLEWILRVVRELRPGLEWTTLRQAYIENSPSEHIYSRIGDSSYDVNFNLAQELLAILEILSPSACRELLNIDPKNRWYECPRCRWPDTDRQYKIAQLRPPTPSSTLLFCHVCKQHFKVSRNRCTQSRCKGNVILSEEHYSDQCLTCGNDL